jgi:hypothetical protein
VNSVETIAHFKREIYIVDNLGPRLLLGIDIITAERIAFDVKDSVLILYTYRDITILVTIVATDPLPQR